MDITKSDKNFIVETKIEQEGLKFYDAESEPFKIYGIFREGDKFRRIPEALAKEVNDGVARLHENTAGGRVRFKTDSRFVAIKAELGDICRFSHMPLTGSSGFDMYEKVDGKHIYRRTFIPPYDMETGYEQICYFKDVNDYCESRDRKMRELTINFPLYNNVKKLYIGIDENASLLPADEYKIAKPVVYYGSSITQGGCASKPGSCYQAILSQNLDINYINLGFSGSARGEDNIVDYMANLDMSAFVLDYDHNAPTLEHLEATHEKAFKTIRAKNPDLPIIILPAPGYAHFQNEPMWDNWLTREGIVKKTYDNAIASGDKNVYFISANELMALVGYNGTVDNCHPTDSGFLSMATAIEPVLKKILKL